MNQADYKAIADIMYLHVNEVALHRKIVTDLADYFEKTENKNKALGLLRFPDFDRSTFLKDCGIN